MLRKAVFFLPVNGVHVSVKNSAEYEELRRILFHPINPRGRHRPGISSGRRGSRIPESANAVY